MRVRSVLPLRLALALAMAPTLAQGHHAGHEQRLPTIGPAPDFSLTSQDGATVALRDFRGRVFAVAFIYTSCPDICPLLTEKMAHVQDELGPDFGTGIVFASITVDPEHDTPQVLKQYATDYGAKLSGWSFLTGTATAIHDVERSYGVAVSKSGAGGIDHTLLTTLVDKHGAMRVQYLGYRFDPEEFRRDLVALLNEP